LKSNEQRPWAGTTVKVEVNEFGNQQLLPPTSGETKSTSINPPPLDLREWKGHRVLAKRSNLYMPGIITAVSGHSTITVLFDRDNIALPYTDVILSRTSFYDIVSDASPAPSQVT